MFSTDQEALLDAPLNTGAVKTRRQGGGNVSYIEGWHAIAEANRIFGHGKWFRETVEMREAREPQEVDGKWRVGFGAKVRITVLGDSQCVREGWGFGSGIAKDQGDAYESAIKEAETDAMKRALMTFGNPFGLALYDKDQRNVSDAPVRKSAAQAKRDGDYDSIVARIDSAATLDDLKREWKAIYPLLETLPASWAEPLTDRKDQRKAELQGHGVDAPLDHGAWVEELKQRLARCEDPEQVKTLADEVSPIVQQYPDSVQQLVAQLVLDATQATAKETA